MRIFEKDGFPIKGTFITLVLVGCLLTPQTITYIHNLSDTLYINENYITYSEEDLYKKHIELSDDLCEAKRAEYKRWVLPSLQSKKRELSLINIAKD